jgi:hypothetical protein
LLQYLKKIPTKTEGISRIKRMNIFYMDTYAPYTSTAVNQKRIVMGNQKMSMTLINQYMVIQEESAKF